jgi:hypothetical protein
VGKKMNQDINKIIRESLGQTSALFMSQKKLGTEIIMPSEKLIKIANKASKDIEVIIGNMLWEIGADIMKKSGVKTIKTSYKNPK